MDSSSSAPLVRRHLDHCVSDDDCDYVRIFNEQQEMNVKAMWATWIVIAGILFFLALWNIYQKSNRKTCAKAAVVETESQTADEKPSGLHRTIHGLQSTGRRWLYPQSIFGIFPRVTRLQGATVIFVTIYSILFSFIGIAYGEWVNPTTPPGRRIGFLEFVGDRTGCLAFAFVPLVFTLSARDNIFSLITGISYQHLNFLHKWIGRFIFILTWVHTILWSIELGIMYQPQPTKYISTWKKRYWKWGVGACALLTFLFLHSFRAVQRWTGYEFFRKSHEFIAVLFLGACWGHWPAMREWLIAGIAIVFFDRFVRYARIFFIHMNWASSEIGAFGFHPHSATIRRYEDSDGIVNIYLTVNNTTIPYTAGQHFFLTFPTLSSFESHPFTTANAPLLSKPVSKASPFNQEYIIRVLSGQTHRLAKLAPEVDTEYTIPVVLCGPYGNPATDLLDQSASGKNFLFVSGGTGVSFTLPLMRTLLESEKSNKGRAINFVWAIRRIENYVWFADEIKALLNSFPGRLHVRVFVTRDGNSSTSEVGSSSASSSGDEEKKAVAVSTTTEAKGFEEINLKNVGASRNGIPKEVEVICLGGRHPDMANDIIAPFKEQCVGNGVRVLGSGPPQMGEALRKSVAAINVGGVNAGLYWDSREY